MIHFDTYLVVEFRGHMIIILKVLKFILWLGVNIVRVGACKFRYLWKPEALDAPGDGAPGNCAPSNMDVVNWIQALCKSNICF